MRQHSYLNQFEHRVTIITYDETAHTESDPIDFTIGQLVALLLQYDQTLPVGIDYPIEHKGETFMSVGGRVISVMQNGAMVNIGTGVDIDDDESNCAHEGSCYCSECGAATDEDGECFTAACSRSKG